MMIQGLGDNSPSHSFFLGGKGWGGAGYTNVFFLVAAAGWAGRRARAC